MNLKDHVAQFWTDLYKRDWDAVATYFGPDSEYTDVPTPPDDVRVAPNRSCAACGSASNAERHQPRRADGRGRGQHGRHRTRRALGMAYRRKRCRCRSCRCSRRLTARSTGGGTTGIWELSWVARPSGG